MFIYHYLFILVLKSPNEEWPITYTFTHSHTHTDEVRKTFYCTVSLLYTCGKYLTSSRNDNSVHADQLLMNGTDGKQNKSNLNCQWEARWPHG